MSKDTDPLYYAKGGTVYKRPVYKRNDNGTHINLGFPVCVMHDAVGQEAAETVADLMNAGSNLMSVG
jgi:urease gamma subunit